MDDAISRSNAISRSAALSMMDEYIDIARDYEIHHAMCVVAAGLAELPTLDVAPVVHAYWIGLEYDGYADGFPVFDTWQCSACGEEFYSEGEPPAYNFCTNCGARMDGEAE